MSTLLLTTICSCRWSGALLLRRRPAVGARAGALVDRAGRRSAWRPCWWPAIPAGTEPFAATDFAWLGWTGSPVDIRFSVALDGLSLWLFGLTALLMVVAVLVSWEAIDEQASLYYRLLLILETGMLGVFVARDIILFYVFFEFTLIPLFFLIGIWGSEERRYAAMKFFLFTLAGSVLTFLGLLAIVLWDYYHPIGDPAAWQMTFSIPELTASLAASADGPGGADLDLPGAVRRLCHQGAAVPAAHLAAAGPRRGARRPAA